MLQKESGIHIKIFYDKGITYESPELLELRSSLRSFEWDRILKIIDLFPIESSIKIKV